MYWYTTVSSPLGELLLSCGQAGLTGLWFAGQRHYAASLEGEGVLAPEHPAFAAVQLWLERYFAGENPGPVPVPLAPAGTPFRRAVWARLRELPRGQTTTYGALARDMGLHPSSARAVGGAVARNPISILIPCHRVVGAGGGLTGYAGGLERKAALLRLEGAAIPSL